jgi:tetratricopeptide (TPR) repeat protein
MLKRFGDTDQPEVADRTAKTCLLLPDAVADIDRALKLADQAVTGTEKSGYFHWFLFGKGLAEYRAGRHLEAVQWLERLTPNAGGEPLGATVFAVLAMAQHRMGRAEEAEAALARAKAIMAKMPDPVRGRPFGHDWLEWLHAQVLCREAEELLKKESGVKGQEPGKQPS